MGLAGGVGEGVRGQGGIWQNLNLILVIIEAQLYFLLTVIWLSEASLLFHLIYFKSSFDHSLNQESWLITTTQWWQLEPIT